MIKKLRYKIEYHVVITFFLITRFIPISIMSLYCANLFLFVGKRLKASKVAYDNLTMIYPELTHNEKNNIVEGVWKNLGHNFAEFEFFSKCSKEVFLKHVKIIGLEHILDLAKHNKPMIFFSAHFSNWEVIAAFLSRHKIKTNMIYRKTNNEVLNDFIVKTRSSDFFFMNEKGKRGASNVIKGIKNNISIASFVDQKLNEGISVPFMGKQANTPPLIAQIAIKYNLPVIGIFVKRIGNLRYELVIEPQLKFKNCNNKDDQIFEIMTTINQKVSDWINIDPSQWFWVHNRWRDSK
jgi:KDO2-lipid IV(A) lauroyltransferase